MKKGDTAGCMKHMNEAHKAMGMRLVARLLDHPYFGFLTSAYGTFRTSHLHRRMSAIGGNADMTRTCRYVG